MKVVAAAATLIRTATDADIPQIVQLGRAFAESTPYGAVIGEVSDERVGNVCRFAFAHGAIFVADSDGDLVGFLAIALLPHEYTGVLESRELAWFVLADWRNWRLGDRLLHAMERWAVLNGVHRVTMIAPVHAPGVARYLARRGYTAVETAYSKAVA